MSENRVRHIVTEGITVCIPEGYTLMHADIHAVKVDYNGEELSIRGTRRRTKELGWTSESGQGEPSKSC